MDSIPKIYVAKAKFDIVFLILIRQLKQTEIGNRNRAGYTF